MEGWTSPRAGQEWGDNWSTSEREDVADMADLPAADNAFPSDVQYGGSAAVPESPAFIGDELPVSSQQQAICGCGGAAEHVKRLAQEREQLEEEIEQRKSAWEREWEELEQDREEAEHSLASFRGGLEAEKKAFYAMLEQEHAAFEAEKARCKEDWEQECAEKRRVLKKELHEAQEVWQAQQQTEEAGLHKAKVEWQRLYCEQRQAFEEECNAFEKEMELTRKQVEDDKTAFEAGVRAQMEQEKEMLARRNEQLDQQQQEQQRRLEEQRAEQCARLQEDWAAHKDKVNEEQQGHRDAMAAERAQLAQELEAERKRALNDVAAQRKLHRQQLKGVAEQVSQTRERLWMAAEEQMACHALQMALAGEKWQADKARHAARVAAAQRRMEAEGREQCLMMRAEMEQLLALQRDEGRRQQLALTQSHEKALREAQQKRHVQETADLVAGEQQQRGGLEVHEGTHFVALVMAHVRDVTALQQREFAAAAQRNDEALAVARAQHRETRQELAKQIADQEAALRQTEARCAARERELEEEHERRQAALQSQEAREREVRHQQRVAEQVAAASALAKLKTEIAEQQKVRARETEAYEEERERRREQLESERQAQEREAAAREAAWESKRRVEEQRLRTLEADLQAADRRREERCQARADAQTRDTERQLRDGRAQAQLFADAFWEKGLAVGAEAGAWAQMQQLERDWHPLSGSKWARQKMDRLLSKEEGQRDRLLMWERDMRRDLLNLMRDDRRDVELAIRDRKARSVRRISALGRIRVKGEAADRAREAVPQRGNPPRLPPLQEVAALLDSAVVSDAAEMAAYKSYFSLQLQEVMKPSESLVL